MPGSPTTQQPIGKNEWVGVCEGCLRPDRLGVGAAGEPARALKQEGVEHLFTAVRVKRRRSQRGLSSKGERSSAKSDAAGRAPKAR